MHSKPRFDTLTLTRTLQFQELYLSFGET